MARNNKSKAQMIPGTRMFAKNLETNIPVGPSSPIVIIRNADFWSSLASEMWVQPRSLAYLELDRER